MQRSESSLRKRGDVAQVSFDKSCQLAMLEPCLRSSGDTIRISSRKEPEMRATSPDFPDFLRPVGGRSAKAERKSGGEVRRQHHRDVASIYLDKSPRLAMLEPCPEWQGALSAESHTTLLNAATAARAGVAKTGQPGCAGGKTVRLSSDCASTPGRAGPWVMMDSCDVRNAFVVESCAQRRRDDRGKLGGSVAGRRRMGNILESRVPSLSRLLSVGALLLVVTDARAQLWSNPTLVAREEFLGGPAQLVCALGDTLWVMDGAWDSVSSAFQVRAYSCTGDSWCGPVTLWTDSAGDFWCTGCASGDSRGRIWVSWSTVLPGQWPPYYWNGAVRFAFRDTSGWHSPDSACYGMTSCPGGMNFAGDRRGNWYMGYSLGYGGGTTGGMGAHYQRWLGSRWDSVIPGLGGGMRTSCGPPLLSMDPDSGLWAAMSYTHGDSHELRVYRVFARTASVRHRLSFSIDYAIATDSSGGVWIIHRQIEDARLRWIRIEHEQIVDSGLVYEPVASNVVAAVDPQGVIWTAWRHGSAVWASYNRGLGWTEPEVVTDSQTALDGLAFDGEGLPSVIFERSVGQMSDIFVTRRLSHVQAAEQRPTHQPSSPLRLLSHSPCNYGVLVEFEVGSAAQVRLRISDISGRTVAALARENLKPGVYRREWQASPDIPNGIYFLSLDVGSYNEIRKLVVVR